MLRQFSIRSVGVNRERIEEFYIGAHIRFYDEYMHTSGSGRIYAFAQEGFKPLCWFYDDTNGELKCVHLGWCVLDE